MSYLKLKNNQSKFKNLNQGFTLVEVMLASVIFAVAFGLIVMMFYHFINSYAFTFEQNRTLSQIKFVTQDIFSQLREIRVSEDGAYPLTIASDQEISFYADINKNGRVERVRYFLDGTSFYRGVIYPNDTLEPYAGETEDLTLISDLVVNGSEPVFYYYNENYPADQTNNPLVPGERLLNTRLIEIRLLLNTSPDSQQPIEVNTKVMLRNLKTNY